MSRIAYVNGRYLPHRDAAVHIEDRGFQFADSVYEVIALYGGRLVDLGLHMERLRRSLAEIRLGFAMGDRALAMVLAEVGRRNGLRDGLVYLQISRGTARRDFAFPRQAEPTLVVTARRHDFGGVEAQARRGVAVITRPDLRWARRDIKSTGMLASVLAKQAAREAGAYECWMVDGQGLVTEGSSTNAWIVDAEGRLRTRALGPEILSGVTRRVLVDVAARTGLRAEERAFTVAEAKAAREAFLSSTTTFVMPVVQIDGVAVGDGRPGPVALKMRESYRAAIIAAPGCEPGRGA